MSHNYHFLWLDKHLESDTICFLTEGCFDQETKDRSHFFVVVFGFSAPEKKSHSFGHQKCV